MSIISSSRGGEDDEEEHRGGGHSSSSHFFYTEAANPPQTEQEHCGAEGPVLLQQKNKQNNGVLSCLLEAPHAQQGLVPLLIGQQES